MDQWNILGSRWWKFDFHTHTPKSDDYGRGNGSLKGISPETWLQNAMESGLDCVVISDHNSGDWIDELKSANSTLHDSDKKPEWYRDLTIFPGVEITIADSSRRVHLLAVFDPACDRNKVSGVLGACGITSRFGDDKSIATTTSFGDTIKIIIQEGGLPIPAHIDGKKGLLEGISTLSPETKNSIDAVSAAEFCNLNAYDKADASLRKKVDKLAKLAGSDAHTPDEIGRYFSWVKMSSPTLEGLRLALQDYEFCVYNGSESPEQLPGTYLMSLMIRNMKYCGRVSGKPFHISFHPHFNALIGGRGTGKSTIIESIRIASRQDRNLAVESPRIKDELDKFMKTSHKEGVMLNDTEIILEIHRRGKKYRLFWRFTGQGNVLEEEISGLWKTVDPGDIVERFPLSIFSQKQINELASNSRGLLEIIDRSQRVNRSEWDAKWEQEKSRFLQLSERKRELSRQLAGEKNLRIRLKDVEHDLKQYEVHGHGEILKKYQKYSQQKNSLPDDHIFNYLSSGIRDLASAAEFSDFPTHLFDENDEATEEIRLIHEQASKALQSISTALGNLAEDVDVLKAKRAENMSSSRWYHAGQDSISAYESLVREYEEKNSRISLSLYGEWVQQRNQLQQQLNRLDSVREDDTSTGIQIEESLTRLQSLRGELLERRRNFLNEVIGSNPYVRMELIQYGDLSSLEEEYRDLLYLESGKFESSVFDRDNQQGLLWPLKNWEDLGKPDTSLPQLISEIKITTLNIANRVSTANHGAFANRLEKVLETQPAVFDQLKAWWPEDLLRVRYSKDTSSGKFEDLEKGSAGQKAAAILAFLLSYGDEPLIIDQPEDDLDNALIYDLIVSQIKENKKRRQLVIVTHNPNIVVNGDSELVHVLKYDRGQVQIDLQGGLEETGVRESICNIMEGGQEAFDKRYARIRTERYNDVRNNS